MQLANGICPANRKQCASSQQRNRNLFKKKIELNHHSSHNARTTKENKSHLRQKSMFFMFVMWGYLHVKWMLVVWKFNQIDPNYAINRCSHWIRLNAIILIGSLEHKQYECKRYMYAEKGKKKRYYRVSAVTFIFRNVFHFCFWMCR